MKNKKGFTLVELLVVIGILGILMGALFPAISAAMLAANTSACSMRCRNLFVGISQANTEREAAGLTSVWPKDNSQKSDDTDDIAGVVPNTAEEYFEELFDIENYGKEEWSPYVSGVDISVLSGSGVPAFTGGSSTLKGDNVAWCVAKGLTDEMEDIVPALVTRNAAVDSLPTSAGPHDMSQDKEVVKMGKANGGASDTPFGNKAFVLIRKGGGVITQTAKYALTSVMFNRQAYSIESENPPQFLDVE